MPSLVPTVQFEKVDEYFRELRHEVKAGVGVIGDAAAYALVWEWGNRRQKKPGPKTVLGTNPDGKMVWMSSQAPFGYVHIYESEYWDVIDEELSKVNWTLEPTKMISQLEAAGKRISQKIAVIIKDRAPVDTGELKQDIQPLNASDPMLDEEMDSYYTTLVLSEQ